MKICWNMGGGKAGILRRLSFQEPSLTILTATQMKQTWDAIPYKIVIFLLRKALGYKVFPDDWIFVGSLTNQYRQIGNAVPYNLAKPIGEEIMKSLLNELYA